MGETVFLRLLEAEDKEAVLATATQHLSTPDGGIIEGTANAGIYAVDPRSFAAIPGSPFAYWGSKRLRGLFLSFPSFERPGRTARGGLKTLLDGRFLRLWWETLPCTESKKWVPIAKGGRFSTFYDAPLLQVNWKSGGAEISWYGFERRPREGFGATGRNVEFYFRPGLIWPRRTNGLNVRVLPSGCIFADKGPAAFLEPFDAARTMALCALMNSSVFKSLIELQLARTELAQSFEVGLIQSTPVPELSDRDTENLAHLTRVIWGDKRTLDSINETSHAFFVPELIQSEENSLAARAESSARKREQIEARITQVQAEIDSEVLRLYGVESCDLLQGRGGRGKSSDADDDDLDDIGEVQRVESVEQSVASLFSYAIGACFGRWDIRIEAVRGRREPEPFDPLPECSPGMLQGEAGLPLTQTPEGYPLRIAANGILVDDTGHASDISTAVRRVFDVLFPQDAEARWQEAGELLGITKSKPEEWLRKEFFAFHLQQYSRSRRKAPIYWQLATSSARYSVWLYLPRLTRDTLFSVLDLVKSKLLHEERQLETLRRDAGPAPSVSQRRALDTQESFVDELRAFREEVARVAPLWNPHLDDGVLINFAPLWRLVPQHRAWQRECKSCWDELTGGEHNWSHFAMHLWPERVVPKCREECNIAIAHGLEDVFWEEGEDGKWKPRAEPKRPIDDLVQERTSAAVRTARDSLLSADTPVTASRRSSTPRTRKARSP